MKCAHCGKELVGRNHQAKFCSRKCTYEFHHPHASAQCIVCGISFVKKNGGQKFCSDKCRNSFYERNTARTAKLQTCPICGKEFLCKRYHRDCCSRKCRLTQMKLEAQETKQSPIKTLNDWCREAAECNLDYGTYRALIGLGKTFEELKSQATNRVGCHAHNHKFL